MVAYGKEELQNLTTELGWKLKVNAAKSSVVKYSLGGNLGAEVVLNGKTLEQMA